MIATEVESNTWEDNSKSVSNLAMGNFGYDSHENNGMHVRPMKLTTVTAYPYSNCIGGQNIIKAAI